MSTADDQMERRPVRAQNESKDTVTKGTQRRADGGGTKKKSKEKLPAGVRVPLWLLRKLIVPIIMLMMLVAGLYIGYVIVGKAPGEDVFQWSTWKHLYDLVFAES